MTFASIGPTSDDAGQPIICIKIFSVDIWWDDLSDMQRMRIRTYHVGRKEWEGWFLSEFETSMPSFRTMLVQGRKQYLVTPMLSLTLRCLGVATRVFSNQVLKIIFLKLDKN